MQRYRNFQFQGKFDYLVRLTSDCPVYYPLMALRMIRETIEKKYDYGEISTPHDFPDGLDAECFSAYTLRKINQHYQETKCQETKQHVTVCLKTKDIPSHHYKLPHDPCFKEFPKLSIDYLDDLDRIKQWMPKIWWMKSGK